MTTEPQTKEEIVRETLVNMAAVFDKIDPEINQLILLANARYQAKIKRRDEAFERLLEILRGRETSD